ncbi:RagB/SusD family nutrient uptake outer membrane protein [Parabacteroides faecis]|uniref:RagB/SusD family nutrient uptake outer membrane protein n=1 Tax=Parabacteroides TaxID=375288 RepID=UPI000EFF483B|nr:MULTISPECIES: RagB/SusD family nutrient uptake outer membrane protein [Parabacteroides]MBC8617183.1 RagB/SusD family nutrient uptake outer membrane protein [Parabacteroides faecis]RHS01130.1 RagB/SusD family nutrient uptake outer membrane protein [Parabacteroides sp. AF14-59]
MKKIIFLLIAVITFNSCSDSFLNLSDPSTLSPNYFPKTMSDMESLMTSCYAEVICFELYGKRVMSKHSFIVDHTADMAWTADPYWNQQATNQVSSDNGYVQTLWWGYYKVIQCANTVLAESAKIDKSSFTENELVRLSQINGEALFWRAWGHQQLIQFWGEGFPCNGDGSKQGVPIRTQVATTSDQMNATRNSVDEVYAQILKDYKEAESLLPDHWTSQADYSRPDKYAVKSFIGQVNLYQGEYNEAKIQLKDVIDNSGKQLVPFAEYSKMFNESQTKFNNESILEINLKDGSSSGWGNWSGGEGSMHAFVASLCFINPDGNVEAAGWGNIYFHDANIERFGSDPRLKVTALEPGTPVIMNGNTTVTAKYKDVEDNIKGWSIGKYVPLTYSTYEKSCCVGINMFLMRLADVYLMYAEACQATGDEANAREYVNRVRRRAYDGDLSYDIKSSGDQLRDDIREERFLELCAEGVQHWVDVCRWKTLDKEISKWYKTTRSGAPHYDAKDLYYPIPKKEMEDNPNIKQSIGYENE